MFINTVAIKTPISSLQLSDASSIVSKETITGVYPDVLIIINNNNNDNKIHLCSGVVKKYCA